jgi:hypothetical protein
MVLSARGLTGLAKYTTSQHGSRVSSSSTKKSLHLQVVEEESNLVRTNYSFTLWNPGEAVGGDYQVVRGVGLSLCACACNPEN